MMGFMYLEIVLSLVPLSGSDDGIYLPRDSVFLVPLSGSDDGIYLPRDSVVPSTIIMLR